MANLKKTSLSEDSAGATPDEVAEFKQMSEEFRGQFKARVAIRQDLLDKLNDIAEAIGVAPGAIIEARLRRFVKAEYPAATKKLAEIAAAKAKAAERE